MGAKVAAGCVGCVEVRGRCVAVAVDDARGVWSRGHHRGTRRKHGVPSVMEARLVLFGFEFMLAWLWLWLSCERRVPPSNWSWTTSGLWMRSL